MNMSKTHTLNITPNKNHIPSLKLPVIKERPNLRQSLSKRPTNINQNHDDYSPNTPLYDINEFAS